MAGHFFHFLGSHFALKRSTIRCMLDSDDIQIAVMGYGGQQAAFDRNLWSWKRLDSSFLAICPEDSPLRVPPGIPLRRVGGQGHRGPAATERLRKILHVLLEREASFTMLFEYDSICLAPELPRMLLQDPTGIWSPRFHSGDRSFKSPWYLFPPWGFSRSALEAVSKFLDTHPGDIEHGFHDRIIGYAAYSERIQVHNTLTLGIGWGCNRVDTPDLFLHMMEAIGNGATLIHHGMKL